MHFFNEGCGAAFGLGLAGHLIFDVVSYGVFILLGVKIGKRCKHNHFPWHKENQG